ncbi:MAG TPA: FAD-binding oxidoreductase [Chthonomonadaceae bacterium]|nr:FAD-binding oxidoreductase [Chthonomonadaceae bacterium]
MPTIHFQGKDYPCSENETVLDCLTRQGETIPSSCRSGVCQTCLMRAVSGTPPPKSQESLKPTLTAQHYFLPCICTPTGDLQIALPADDIVQRTAATLVARERLNHDIVRLLLQSQQDFDFRAGQFAHLSRPDGLIRSYSLAGLPHTDGLIEFHVRRLPGGAMSTWLHEEVAVGETVQVTGPSGNCFYTPDNPDQGLLLIGTGSGLAPLWGILQDALRQGHRGPIHLYHGSWNPAGLYLVNELRQLAARHPNFIYTPCVDAEAGSGDTLGRADLVALGALANLKGWRVFLCGHPEMVRNARKKAFLMGASMKDIYADPFVLSAKAA